jgi:hypothetical protein
MDYDYNMKFLKTHWYIIVFYPFENIKNPIKIALSKAKKFQRNVQFCRLCRNPTLEKWEDDSLTPKMGTWESVGTSETSEISEFNCKGQNTLHLGVFYIIRKLLTCRCWKWACMSHLDICSTSYEQKKGRESNW